MRTNKICIYVGKRGTGKTDFIKELIPLFPQPKTLIVDLFDNPVWENMATHLHPEWQLQTIHVLPPEHIYRHKTGIFRTYSSDIDQLETIIDQHVRNTALIMEDSSRWFNFTLTKTQKRYLLNSKQTNCDIHLFFHTLSAVPRELIKYADYLTLFKTGESTYDRNKYILPTFEKAFRHISGSSNQYENITIALQ